MRIERAVAAPMGRTDAAAPRGLATVAAMGLATVASAAMERVAVTAMEQATAVAMERVTARAAAVERVVAAAMGRATAAATEPVTAAATEPVTAAAMDHTAAGPMEQAFVAAMEQAAAPAAEQSWEWEGLCATTRTDWALAVCRRTTGQTAGVMGVWMEQAVAIIAELMEVGATAAVSLGWAAAGEMDPLLWMAPGLRDRASAGPMERVGETMAVPIWATALAAGGRLVSMGLVTGRPSRVGAGFMGQGARACMLPMEQVVTSAVSAEPGGREEWA
jgi:hypothetical protein